MKTNQNMIRKMGNFEVIQRTKDGFFNATSLLKQWNEFVRSVNLNAANFDQINENSNGGNSPHLKEKDIKEFFSNKVTQEYIVVILSKENLSNKNSVYTASRGNKGG